MIIVRKLDATGTLTMRLPEQHTFAGNLFHLLATLTGGALWVLARGRTRTILTREWFAAGAGDRLDESPLTSRTTSSGTQL